MRTRRPALLLALLLGLLVLPLPGQPAASAAYDPHYTWTLSPSPVVLLLPERMVRLKPRTFCWEAPSESGPDGDIGAALCADGIAPRNSQLTKVEQHRRIRFWFGRPGWRWHVRTTSIEHPRRPGCTTTTRPARASAQRFDIATPRHRGTYRVRVFGRGPEGDVTVYFRWKYGRTAGRC